MDLVAIKDIEQFRRIRLVMVYLEPGTRRIEHLCMHGNYQRSRLVHIRQVFAQPFKLFVGNCLYIVARISAVIFIAVYIIQHNEMDLAYIKRIICRCNVPHILEGCIKIRICLEIIVMVSHGMKNLQIADSGIHGGQIFREII